MINERPVWICPYCGAKKIGSPNIRRDEEIRRLYRYSRPTWNLDELSRKYNIGTERIKQIIGRNNLRDADRYKNRLSKRSTEIRNERLYFWYKKGKTYSTLAMEYSITPERVRQIVKRLEKIERHKRQQEQK